jgi:ATP-dependent DNA helicase Rep
MLNKAADEDDKNIQTVIRKLVLIDLLEQQAEADDSDKVQLMTLHAAKGLGVSSCVYDWFRRRFITTS